MATMIENGLLLNCTGADVDEAVQRFKDGWIEKPTEHLHLDKNVWEKDILNYAKLTVEVPQEEPEIYTFPNIIIPSDQQQDFNPTSYGADGFGEFTVDKIPDSFVEPLGILTNDLITRASDNNSHNATIPGGYYVNESFQISEWVSGQKTGGSNTFTLEEGDGIRFKPKWAAIILNAGSIAANTVLAFISTGSASRVIFTKSVSSSRYEIGFVTTFNASINQTTVVFPNVTYTSGSSTVSTKYSGSRYRWYALR